MKLLRISIYILLLLPLFIIFFFWWERSGLNYFHNIDTAFISLGRLSGLCAVYLVLMQFLLRSRITPLEKILGFSTLNTLHKKNGYLIYSLLVLHGIFLSLGYAMIDGTNFFSQIYLFLFTYEGVLKAFIAFLILSAVVISSVSMVRKKLPYELWYFIHLATYIFVIFAWDHQLKVGKDFVDNQPFVIFWYGLYAAIFGSLLYWRIWKQLYGYYSHSFRISKVVKETSDTYSIYITGENLNDYYFLPGQFAFVRFLTEDMWWESHPFSYSSTPHKNHFRFTIKASGDFTSKIHTIKRKTPVIIDGPHGDFIARNSKAKILFIAGGAGITPIRALLEQIANKDTILLYGCKKETDIIFKKELLTLSQKRHFRMITVISNSKSYRGLKGRITAKFVKKRVKDISTREVFICGPERMVTTLQKSLIKILPKERIHTEVFSL